MDPEVMEKILPHWKPPEKKRKEILLMHKMQSI
jgi:hypothetical protein